MMLGSSGPMGNINFHAFSNWTKILASFA